MKKNLQITDYGIYIDHPHCFIVAIENNSLHVEKIESGVKYRNRFKGETTDKTSEKWFTVDRQSKKQNKFHNDLQKYYKTIVEKLEHANRIIICGPSEAKFELQKEMKKNKSLKNVFEEVKKADKMTKNQIISYVKEHFAAEVPAEG